MTRAQAEVAKAAGNPIDVKFEFSAKTSNTSLRDYIECYHDSLYLQECADHGLAINIPGIMSPEDQAQTTLDKHVHPGVGPWAKFSQVALRSHLVAWIAADDQVWLYSITTMILR